jgi:hypothetical protein
MTLADPKALLSSPVRRLFATKVAAREIFTPGELIEDWLRENRAATAEQQVEVLQAAIELRDASSPCVDPQGREAFRLRTTERQGLLRAVGRAAVLKELEQAADSRLSLTEQFVRGMLAGSPVMPDFSDRTQLVAMHEAVEWTASLDVPAKTDAQELNRHLQRFDFLQGLGGGDLHRFVGRRQFRKQLMDEWSRRGEIPRIVLVEGPGGVGKSLGVARFIADALEGSDPDNVPHAVFHLDFDRAGLRAATDATLLQELVRQAASWADAQASELLKELEQDFDGYDAEPAFAAGRGYRPDKQSVAASLAASLGRGEPLRAILFADSFEQVDGEDDLAASSVEQVARLLAPFCARLMVVYASRAFESSVAMRASLILPLNGLPNSDADTYLQIEADRLGVDVRAADLVAIREIVGTTPLALRLAVRVLEQAEQPIRVGELAKLASKSPEMTQALLYDRILRRLKDDTLRCFALPSMQLRRITADVIEHVLAEPCGLDPDVSGDALFELCRRERTMFSAISDQPGEEAIRHRQDVRSNLLAHVDRSMDAEVKRRINEAAIWYYSARMGLPSRAEELYHRLRMDEPEEEIASRWVPEAAELLRPSMSELPPNARAFLRKRLGSATALGAQSELSRAVLVSGSSVAEDSTREFENYARKLLQSGDDVGFIVRELEDRPKFLTMQLGDVYAAALMQSRQHAKLLEFTRTFASQRPSVRNRRPGSAVLGIAAALLEGRGELAQSQHYWIQGLRWAKPLDAIAQLPCLVGSARLRRKLGTGQRRRNEELRKGVHLLERAEIELRHATLAREIAAEFGELLLPAQDRRDEELDPLRRIVLSVLETHQAFPSAVADKARVLEIGERIFGTQTISLSQLSSVATRLLYSTGPDTLMWQRLVDALREEVDWTLREAAMPQEAPLPG